MHAYMILAKYSSTGAKAVLSEGFVSRQQAAERLMEAAGGGVIAYYAITDGDWDVVNVSEFPTAGVMEKPPALPPS